MSKVLSFDGDLRGAVAVLCGASVRHSDHRRNYLSAFEWDALADLIDAVIAVDPEFDPDEDDEQTCGFCGERFAALDDVDLVLEHGRPVCVHADGCNG